MFYYFATGLSYLLIEGTLLSRSLVRVTVVSLWKNLLINQ